MDGVLTLAFIYLLVCTVPVLVGACVLAMEHRSPIRSSSAGVSWFCRETAAYAVVIAALPFGWWPVSPLQHSRKEDIAETPSTNLNRLPVLLVHGYGMNRACFTFLKTYLHTRGWDWVWAINHRPRSSPIPVFAKHLGRSIERLLEESGATQIDIVAHSMGGVITAYALQEYGYARHVRKVITLGTPWAGTLTYVFAWLREGKDMAPDSEVIEVLEHYKGDTVAIWSRHDHMNVPTSSANPAHARSIEVPHLGHQEMLTSARCFRIVAETLNEQDEPVEGPE
jgi:hypothetical protein